MRYIIILIAMLAITSCSKENAERRELRGDYSGTYYRFDNREYPASLSMNIRKYSFDISTAPDQSLLEKGTYSFPEAGEIVFNNELNYTDTLSHVDGAFTYELNDDILSLYRNGKLRARFEED